MIKRNNHVKYIWQTEQWPNFSYGSEDVQPALDRALFLIGQISGLHQSFTLNEQHQALAEEVAQEAVASYAIEGENLNLRSVSISVMASLDDRYRQHLDNRSPNIASLMLDARQHSQPLTQERLFNWHKLMFSEPSFIIKDVGRWRSGHMEVVSGNLGNYTTEFQAPPANQIPELMKVFLHWLEQDQSLPLPIKAAVSHVWFETIHPFEDGNGRTGRLIIESVLAGIADTPLPISPSRGILQHRADYYKLLKQAQSAGSVTGDAIDITDFVKWFLTILAESAQSALKHLTFLTRRNQFFTKWSGQLNKRQELVLRRIFEEGEKRVIEGLSRKPYVKICGTSDETASRDLKDLLDKGILLPSEGKGRGTLYPVKW